MAINLIASCRIELLGGAISHEHFETDWLTGQYVLLQVTQQLRGETSIADLPSRKKLPDVVEVTNIPIQAIRDYPGVQQHSKA